MDLTKCDRFACVRFGAGISDVLVGAVSRRVSMRKSKEVKWFLKMEEKLAFNHNRREPR
jgi:hypothetical protein